MIDCVVYCATRMTGRSKHDQVKRAQYVCQILKQYGLTPISPVLEENVDDSPEVLVNDNKEKLEGFWRRDKYIIRRIAHVVLVDGAHEKSMGVEREYALSRFCIWKPTVLIMPNIGLSVSDFEDDYRTNDVHIAGAFIQHKFGTQWRRINWRIRMLAKSLPLWLLDQVCAWR